ncbi:heme exporter protein CcmB [Oricola cellulosilytica]|uniref:Heme exporter protein B n=1 Tax=Oricola cellulosilytica TaxID=1429082 RepID=A0A4V2MP10_9HYPH|nr:heme exporter protein CcmB [Oricola cellulosilytica]TCD15872.1 heme exporter protein CcmB [Oricola cellulosilytica]
MIALIVRDIRIGLRAGGGMLIGILFFLAVITVVPFGIGPDLNLLARIGPALLWIGALLAALLGLDRLFQADLEDGSLDLLILRRHDHAPALTVFAKCVAHWLTTGLPLVIVSPVLGLLMNMEPAAIGATTLTLLAGTPAITFIGATGAAVAVALPRGGLLVSVMVLPFVIPVLIFGVMAAYGAVEEPAPFTQPFLLLCALTLFFAVLGPLAAGAALKAAGD